MFPLQRNRRLRQSQAVRALVREHSLSPDNFIVPLFIVEGTQELGNLLENEGEKLGVYIYNRLEENVKRSELIFEVKEILIETITEKIALSTKLF